MNYRGSRQRVQYVTDNSSVNSVKEKTSEISEQIESLEIVVHTLWRLLKKNGVSEEDFMNELDAVTKLHMKKSANPEILCPKCGKIMQIGNITGTTANCMYCGTKTSFSPFDKYEKVDDEISEEVTDDISGETTSASSYNLDDEFPM